MAPEPRQQRGVVLLLMLLVLMVTGSSFLLAAINTGLTDRSGHDDRIRALQTAKENLLAYAVHSDMLADTGPGKLPCPDTDNDGLPDCGGATLTGRLPQRAPVSGGTDYRFSDAPAGLDRQLWYAVSPGFMIDSIETPVNSTTAAELTVNSRDQQVAVLMAPGRALGNQTRPDNNDLLQYLEQENADNDPVFRTPADNPATGNDIVLGITRNELLSLVVPRVIEAFRARLSEAENLPLTATGFHGLFTETSAPKWLLDNNWVGEEDSGTEYTLDEENDTALIAFPDFDECPEPLSYRLSAPPETVAVLLERDC